MPQGARRFVHQVHGDHDLIPAPGSQVPDLAESASRFQRGIEAAPASCDVPQEPNRVEEVGLAGGVGTNQEDTLRYLYVDIGEIFPVDQ